MHVLYGSIDPQLDIGDLVRERERERQRMSERALFQTSLPIIVAVRRSGCDGAGLGVGEGLGEGSILLSDDVEDDDACGGDAFWVRNERKDVNV